MTIYSSDKTNAIKFIASRASTAAARGASLADAPTNNPDIPTQ